VRCRGGPSGTAATLFDELGEISNRSSCFSTENDGTAAGLAGHSGLMGVHAEGMTNLKAVRRIVVDPMTAGHRGRIVKTTVNYEDQLPTQGHLGWRLNELADTGKK
jgi:hypothetical protein